MNKWMKESLGCEDHESDIFQSEISKLLTKETP
jgi:hypothetical protein